MPRMQILNSAEQELFNKPPIFNHVERKKFFDIPKRLIEIAKNLNNPENKIGFLISCSYFRATRRFFLPADFHHTDIQAAINMLGISHSGTIQYSDTSRYRHQSIILKHYGFSAFKKEEKKQLKLEIFSMAKMYVKPRLIFNRCIDWLTQKRVQIPTLRTITDLIRGVVGQHKSTLSDTMHDILSAKSKELLDSLFAKGDDTHLYRLTLLKKLSQSTKPSKVKECVSDFQCIAELYNDISDVITILGLEKSAIQYFAGSVLRSQIFQIQRREEADKYIHTTAFIAHQYYRMHDNLIDIFLNVMTSFHSTVNKEKNEILAEQQEKQASKLKSMVKIFDHEVIGLIRSIRSIAHSQEISDQQKVLEIQKILKQKSLQNTENLQEDMAAMSASHDNIFYDLSEARSIRLQNRLSAIVKSVIWHAEPAVSKLFRAIQCFQSKGGIINDNAPQDFLDDAEKRALYQPDGMFRVSLYKVFLFQHIALALKSGNLNVEHSYKYRPLDHYLIDRTRWESEKEMLLKRADMQNFANPETILPTLDEALYTEYRKVNQRVPENNYLSFGKDSKFRIKTPALEASDTDPLQSYFPNRHYIPLAEILDTVHAHTDMLSALTHWQQTHTSDNASRPALLASIIGLGCGIGVRKMARISSHVSESELDNIVNWRFSLENIREANDKVVMMMDKMDLPNIYRLHDGLLHTASDGSKYLVRKESLHASRSFKYFGQEQGVSVNSFIDERNFLWYSLVMSAATRESMGVIDGLMHNDIIKSNIHSTDTHGYSEAIFGLTHMLGISFAPRLKGLKNKQLYIFKHHDREKRKDWHITPDSYVNEKIIHQNWDDFLRLVVTIKLKENTASDIFRRLNSYSRQHSLYQTVKSFGQIIKSLFILRYLDNLELRQAIEKQLNKVELANRFSRAVAVGNPREITQTEPVEQEIAESCNRLIKNSIICWNYMYLSHLLQKMRDLQEKEILLSIISTHSIMTWEHINMLGEYDFSDEKRRDSVGISPPKMAA